MDDERLFIHLRSTIFSIPSNFHFLTDINHDIYSKLMTQKKYKIKSNARESVCQSFIDYWVYNKTPKITILNISEYEDLSQEFEFMENLVQIFKMQSPISHLFFENQELKAKLQSMQSTFSQTTENYQKIIQYLFNEDRISVNSFLDSYLQFKLYQSCIKEKVELVYLLTRKILNENGLFYSLNEDEKTAGIVGCHLSNDYDVTIPKFVIHESQEYVVTNIHKEAFKKSDISEVKFEGGSVLKILDDESFISLSLFSIWTPKHVTQISTRDLCCPPLLYATFSEDSEKLKATGEDEFGSSQLNSLELPPSVEENKDCFCSSDQKVTDQKKFPFESNFYEIYLDKFLLGKTNPNRSRFDVLISYSGIYESIIIPSFIRRIGPSAFFGFGNLYEVTFSEDSKLESIGNYSFGHCSIKSISIPSHVTIIEEGAFFECNDLEKVTFSEDSKLLTIEKKAFCETNIQSLSIPSTIIELKSRWCEETPNLIDVRISPKSSNFAYLDNGLIVGRSESSGDVYDTIIFAPRNMKKVTIPSFIKKIAGAAFCECKNLKNIEFSDYSKLEIIERNGLSSISIKNISIPKHVKEIGTMAFYCNRSMRKIEFAEDSELLLIKKLAFYQISIRSIEFPSSLKRIGKYAFEFCQSLKYVDFKEDCHLKFIDKGAFNYTEITSVLIPSSVCEIGENAFANCYSLQIIEINENSQLTMIRSDMFQNSTNAILMSPHGFIYIQK